MILQIINVVIGLSAIYLIFSTVASVIFELLESVLKKRGKLLFKGVYEILSVGAKDDSQAGLVDQAVEAFYKSPFIYSLYAGKYEKNSRRLPSYIPPAKFAAAVVTLADQPDAPARELFVALKKMAEQMIALQPLQAGELYAKKLEDALVSHFNDSMDRVSGWFARHARACLLAIGLLLAICANVDSVAIIQTLGTNDALAEQIADNAAAQLKDQLKNAVAPPAADPQDNAGASSTPATPAATTDSGPAASTAPAAPAATQQSTDPNTVLLKEMHRELGVAQTFGLPIGWGVGEVGNALSNTARQQHEEMWKALPQLAWSYHGKWPGWLITAFALSLGAPFWFDLMNQMISLRSSLKPDDKQPKPGEAPATNRPKAA